ncbi:MAG: hypothetical protein FJX76_20000, partial [Armatimonadetes bacterium]|nr:hypothetical protein [Armatimonadota bacterium]
MRLFVAPQAPTLPSPSQLSTLSPTATAFVTDGAMTIDAGDMVMCASTANPNAPAYSFHMVTTGATGVSSSSLRLDNSS